MLNVYIVFYYPFGSPATWKWGQSIDLIRCALIRTWRVVLLLGVTGSIIASHGSCYIVRSAGKMEFGVQCLEANQIPRLKNHLQACIMKPIEVTKGKHWHAVFRGANLWGYEKTTTMQLSLQALLCQLHWVYVFIYTCVHILYIYISYIDMFFPRRRRENNWMRHSAGRMYT